MDKNHQKNGLAPTDPGSVGDFLSHGLEGCSIILDSRLETLGIGEDARLALGSISQKSAIGDFLSPADAFRLEEFAKNSPAYAELSTLELTLSGVPGFSYACACRREVFGANAIILTLYANKRDFLLAHESMAAFNFLPLSEKSLMPKIESVRGMIGIFAESHPDEAAILRSTVDELIRKSLANSIICSILSQRGDANQSYDLISLAETATAHVKSSLADADLAFSLVGEPRHSGVSAPGIPAEHMWYLMTCALTTAVRMSGHGRTVLSLLMENGRLVMRTTSPNSPFAQRLPERMTLSEFRNVVPASALRLYLCDLTCEEYGIASGVRCESDVLEITFEFTPRDKGRSFHRFDPVFPVDEWKSVADTVIIPDMDEI